MYQFTRHVSLTHGLVFHPKLIPNELAHGYTHAEKLNAEHLASTKSLNHHEEQSHGNEAEKIENGELSKTNAFISELEKNLMEVDYIEKLEVTPDFYTLSHNPFGDQQLDSDDANTTHTLGANQADTEGADTDLDDQPSNTSGNAESILQPPPKKSKLSNEPSAKIQSPERDILRFFPVKCSQLR